MTKAILSLLILILISSCSANWHLKKALQKDSSLFTDTLKVERIDTVLFEVPIIETRLKFHRDTLIKYEQGKNIIEYKYFSKTDSIYITCDPADTVFLEKEVIKTVSEVVKPSFWENSKIFIILILIIAIVLIFLKLIK